MTFKEINGHIGKKVTLNSKSNLDMNFELQVLIYNKTILTVKKIKTGKVVVVDDKDKEYLVQYKNIDKYD